MVGLVWTTGEYVAGMILSAANAALVPLTLTIYARWINPNFFATMIEHSVRTGQATRAAAAESFNLGTYIVQSMGFSMVAGFVTAAIATAVLRRGPERGLPDAATA